MRGCDWPPVIIPAPWPQIIGNAIVLMDQILRDGSDVPDGRAVRTQNAWRSERGSVMCSLSIVGFRKLPCHLRVIACASKECVDRRRANWGSGIGIGVVTIRRSGELLVVLRSLTNSKKCNGRRLGIHALASIHRPFAMCVAGGSAARIRY